MITDLLRNDLGKVCEYGSVRVTERRTLEEYPYVFQATSTIEGTLCEDKDCFDLLRACFPGGSVTGCPKIRAMEIIEELEPTRRGMYTGSLGYINFDGNMDLNILIRTVLAFRDRMYFQAGGGIVADSTPEDEYAETLVKAEAIKRCLRTGLGKTASGSRVLR
jgi:para-aminobenzoate synthetase component 1